MSNSHNAVSGGAQLPKEFFTIPTFGTLGGCALVTWVVSGVLSGVFQIDLKIIGLIVSVVVAYVGLFLSKDRQKAQYIITFFNGFLIYATVIGGTSFLPYINPETAKVTQEKELSIKTALTRPWIPDQNLVVATKQLLEINDEQANALNESKERIEEITRYTLEVTPPSTQRGELLERLSHSREIIEDTDLRVRPKVDALERMGVRLDPR